VIVRISTEGQYRLPDGDADRLNDLDNDVVAAVDAGDEDRFHEVFEQMLDLVRSEGRPLAVDVLEESDVILPPPDLTFVEAGEQFTGDGLIPD
jgi:PspAA-like protein